ncbi:putative glypican [Schistosoma mansoni]|nr:putative glypican [Schistosoma mansoni]|eukprot:XP_018648435.1 putative glypican [Schistosoma mansoni]
MTNFEVMRTSCSILLIVTLCTSAYALDCTIFKQEWMKLRYTMLTGVHSSTIIGPTSNICPVTGTSCCDVSMEHEMYSVGQRQLIKQSNSWLQVAWKMSNDSAVLESIFQADLQQAKRRLHQFFSRIYGYNYKLHRNFFFGFFTDLEQYMAGQRGQLGVLIKNFFSQLRDNIVSLIEKSGQVISNPPFGSFSPNTGSFGNNLHGVSGTDEASESRRIRCLSEKIAQLHPFDDVDVRLHARMMEAYPPARMLVNVLSVTSKLLHHLVDQVVAQSQCILGITRYKFCAICGAQSLDNVCPESCSQLLARCLHGGGPDEAQLAYIWPQLIDTIIMATNRLERSFNFPAVNRNLQMEISEAITSLQTRYSETKSKFESECQFGSAGQRMPTLFNPIRPSHSSQENRANHSDISRWSMISNMNRRLNRIARSSSYPHSSPVSQEFLDWQTRQQLSQVIPSNNRPKKKDYSQQRTSKTSDDWDASDKENPMNAPHDLVRQVNEIKQAYSSLRDLFSGPAGNLCPTNSTAMSNGNLSHVNQSTHCWNPPRLPDTPPDAGITQILTQLYEASKRLHEASTNTKDPDTLVVKLPPRSNSAPGTYSRNDQNSYLSASLTDPLSANQFLAQDQWQGPKQSRMDNSYETERNIRIESGSGNQPNSLQFPDDSLSQSYEQSSSQFNNMFPDDPQNKNDPRMYSSVINADTKRTGVSQGTDSNRYFNQKSTQQWPQKSSVYNSWGNVEHQRDKWKFNGSTDFNIPIFQEPTTESVPLTTGMTTTTTTITFSSTTVTASTALLYNSTGLITTPSALEKPSDTSSLEVKDIVTESVTRQTPLTVRTDSALDRHPQTTTQLYIDPKLKSGTYTESFLPSTDQSSNIGFLPDDEDNTQMISKQIPYQTPDSQKINSWHQTSEVSRRRFHEGSGGSGISPSVLTPQYQGPQTLWTQSGRKLANPNAADTRYNEEFIGPQPDKNQPFYPTTQEPENRGDEEVWNVSPDKLASGFLEGASGMSPNIEWNEDKNDRHTGSSQWQDTPGGSRRGNPGILQNPVPEDTAILPPSAQPTQPPIPSRVDHVPEVLPQPPLPPPEVWVPAKLSPGQPVPPILLIREYSVEGPLYGKEDTVSHNYNSAPHQQLITSIFLPLLTIFIL